MKEARFLLVAAVQQDLLADAQAWRRTDQARSYRRKGRRAGWKWRPRWTLPAPLRPATKVCEVPS